MISLVMFIELLSLKLIIRFVVLFFVFLMVLRIVVLDGLGLIFVNREI